VVPVTDLTDEPTYTLNDAARELKRRECFASSGHGPYHTSRTYTDGATVAWCECGERTWIPVPKDEPSHG
jgi:hypothetical protein